MEYFPLFIDLRERDCLVVGGSETAARKVRLLRQAEARVIVAAAALCPALQALAGRGEISHFEDRLTTAILARQRLIIAAAAEPALNRWVSAEAQRLNIPVNVVDDPALCSAIMPAIIDRSPVVVAIGSGGSAPVLTRLLRSRIEALLPPGLGRLARVAGTLRGHIRLLLRDPAARRQFWERFLRSPLAARIMTDAGYDHEQACEQVLQQASGGRPPGSIQLLARVPVDPEQLTLRAVRLLASADVVAHDPAIPASVLDYARRDANFTTLPPHDSSSEILIQTLADCVRRGLQIVWLARHDLTREYAALQRHGITPCWIP